MTLFTVASATESVKIDDNGYKALQSIKSLIIGKSCGYTKVTSNSRAEVVAHAFENILQEKYAVKYFIVITIECSCPLLTCNEWFDRIGKA